ncbi:hypothetical protein [Streptomyces alkaliterrae]|uniref:Uncharacterized protein n=1 Tax=Streptomyces alkaliterrae TaxID=2213162 RepID=A0A5P0YX67_9ACTN|nr:hypothetical protein [Streptomyces alkaliterrae]MBB1262096.1 hypothetical protein [Streptomyces alkaliterrae]MQS04878.1 hypothetical protein [Streptomyces alkaliterrae]
MPIPRFLAGFDSASAMLRANAAFLRGEGFPSLGHPAPLRPIVRATRLLPERAREMFFVVSGATETISPRRTGRIDLEDVSRWVGEEYPERRYPAIAVGSSCGALVHLWVALGVPWLPQTFFVPVRQRVHPDDPSGAMIRGVEPGRALLEANPDVQLHHMHDANQDRLMVRALTYFRYKRRTLGPGYERFLGERLEPGGTIVISDCRRRSGTNRLGPRHVFQHGALGGATEEEFHHGGERVAEYLERYDSPVRRWYGPEPEEKSPEAEWGFEEALAEDVERFAREHGYRVRRLAFDEPESPSPLVADLYRWWYRRRGIEARRLYVESFIVMEPRLVLRTGSVPFWMKFNTETSYRALEQYLDDGEREPYDEILMTLFQNGVEAVGLTKIGEWRRLLAKARVEGDFAGLDAGSHPRDLAHYTTYDNALRKKASEWYPMPDSLTLDEVDGFMAGAGGYEGVRWV